MLLIMRLFYFALFLTLVACQKDPTVQENPYACSAMFVNTHPDSSKFQAYLDRKTSEGLPAMAMMISHSLAIQPLATPMAPTIRPNSL